MKLIVEFGIEPGLLDKPGEFVDALMKTIQTLGMVIPAGESMSEAYSDVLEKYGTDGKKTLFELRHGTSIDDIDNPVAARVVLDAASFDTSAAVVTDDALVLSSEEDITEAHNAIYSGKRKDVDHLRVGARKEARETSN